MSYMEWAKVQAAGMAAAKDFTEQRREARRLPGATVAEIKRRNKERFPCGIKGCTRTAYKGKLCKAHWNLVPYEEKMKLQIESITAAHRVADKHHRRFLRIVREKVAA